MIRFEIIFTVLGVVLFASDQGGSGKIARGGNPTSSVAKTEQLDQSLSYPSPSSECGQLDSKFMSSVAGLEIHNGKVQLFSESTCSIPNSNVVAVSSGTACKLPV